MPMRILMHKAQLEPSEKHGAFERYQSADWKDRSHCYAKLEDNKCSLIQWYLKQSTFVRASQQTKHKSLECTTVFPLPFTNRNSFLCKNLLLIVLRISVFGFLKASL